MFTSLRNSTANKSATPPSVAPPIPAAFAPKRGSFAPPPVRRVSPASPPETEPEPELKPEQEEAAGEWAEALYDYNSPVRMFGSSVQPYLTTCCVVWTITYNIGNCGFGDQSRSTNSGYREVFCGLVCCSCWLCELLTLIPTRFPTLSSGGLGQSMGKVDSFQLLMSSSYDIKYQ